MVLLRARSARTLNASDGERGDPPDRLANQFIFHQDVQPAEPPHDVSTTAVTDASLDTSRSTNVRPSRPVSADASRLVPTT